MRQSVSLEAASASGDGTRLLAPKQGAVEFAPGEYVIDVETASDGGSAPKIVAIDVERRETAISLQKAAPASWHGAARFSHTIVAIAAAAGPDAPQIVRCSVSTETPARAGVLPSPLRGVTRAIYSRSPSFIRKLANEMAAALRKGRQGPENDAERVAGEIRLLGDDASTSKELAAFRADFDARFAVARGVVEANSEKSTPTIRRAAARLTAFYLPQFHRIPENDAWWGSGFTEWTNVTKAAPQFVGHHQPRLPGELGFYDLTAPDALSRQVALAREYGVSAFCFYYYWFDGKRLLERPLDAFMKRGLKFDFTLCWANENWTRRWDGADQHVLIGQRHSPEDHVRVFDDMARYLEDDRAIRIEGKPLLLVYRPGIIPDARVMTELWRERAHQRGWPGVYLAATDAFQFDDPIAHGFDALVELPPHRLVPDRIEKSLSWLNTRHSGAVFDYQRAAADAIARLNRRSSGPFAHFPGVMPGWDNEARRPGAGTIFHGATPEAYARWLDAACAAAERTLPADRRFVFINAWNEWAEGAYLEPDRKWGRAFLEATRGSAPDDKKPA